MKFLESAGHQTEIVENGALALEAVKKNFYDVRRNSVTCIVSRPSLTSLGSRASQIVLMDLSMPFMGEFELSMLVFLV